jgi:hypothetical protein
LYKQARREQGRNGGANGLLAKIQFPLPSATICERMDKDIQIHSVLQGIIGGHDDTPNCLDNFCNYINFQHCVYVYTTGVAAAKIGLQRVLSPIRLKCMEK